jgi:pimeloyl-ACP methyl ester carboxylesterase
MLGLRESDKYPPRRILSLDKAQKVYLAGHSRGGAICVQIAKLLRPEDIRIECMILFDAVDRTLALNAKCIPGNVVQACHAMRDVAVDAQI